MTYHGRTTMYDGLTDAEYEEEVRCAALGLEGPNAKTYRAATWADLADHARKAAKENPTREDESDD
jgi:hypothetical protein